ncbi:polymorphic toxin-type HINT domain-containing protein [Novipirellula herctigrandis]
MRFLCGLILLCIGDAAEAWSVDLSSLKDPLQATLQAEARGEITDRSVLKAHHDAAPIGAFARWQAGQVCLDDTWLGVDELNSDRMTPLLEEYDQERGDGPLNLNDHRRLANWAEQHGLKDQAKAHWYGVLAARSDDRMARTKLQFERIGDQWLTKDEIREARQKSNELVKQTKAWMPQMKKWAASLLGSKTKEKIKTLDALDELQDSTAIHALQLTALQLPGNTALPFVDAIKNVRSQEACDALVKIAMSELTSKRGQSAMNGIKEYPMVFYVPGLLEMLSTETEVKHLVFQRANGERILRLAMSQELRDLEQIAVVDKVLYKPNRLTVARMSRPRSAMPAGMQPGQTLTIPFSKNAVAQQIVDQSTQSEINRAIKNNDANNFTKAIAQERVFDLLQAATDAEVDRNTNAWWGWWDRYNEQLHYGEKNRDRRYYEDRKDIVYASQPVIILVLINRECLIRGTQVQTEYGLRNIESIRVGDRVLSQDVASGELKLKPVLNTTHRPPAKTFVFSTQEGKIEATLGHYWWVSGRGWLRSKELEPGMVLRHATGTTAIEAVELAEEPVETFNLIVADNHTYFVGPERILCSDATEIRPTLQVVPGLPVNVLAVHAK